MEKILSMDDFRDAKGYQYNDVDKYPLKEDDLREKAIKVIMILIIPLFILFVKVQLDVSKDKSEFNDFLYSDSKEIQSVSIFSNNEKIIKIIDIDIISVFMSIMKESRVESHGQKLDIASYDIKVHFVTNESIIFHVRIFQSKNNEIYSTVRYGSTYLNKDLADFIYNITSDN